jgi:PAP2 superfamily
MMSALAIGWSNGRSTRLLGQPLAWALIAMLAAVDLPWSLIVGLSISGIERPIVVMVGLLSLRAAYRQRSCMLADTAEAAALWTAFTLAGCILTYLCATVAWPLQDNVLARLDRATTFDWLGWYHVVAAWPALHVLLALAYASLLPQLLVAIVCLPMMGLSDRGGELILLAIVTLVPSALISLACPAIGPLNGDHASYVPHLLMLRTTGPWHFEVTSLQGIIVMPSYHTVMAIVFTYAFRRTGWIGRAIAGLNVVMLPSILVIGPHYLVDMIAGAAIATFCIFGLRLARRR